MYKYLITYYYGKGPTPTAYNVELIIPFYLDDISRREKDSVYVLLLAHEKISEKYLWSGQWPKPLKIS